MAACLMWPAGAHATGGKPKTSLRVHFEVSPATPAGQRQTFKLEKPPIEVPVSKFPELWEKHLVGIEPFPARPGSVLLTFDDHGKRVLYFLTEAQKGRHMIVAVNGKVVFAPIVDSTLPNGQILVPAGIQGKELTDLQRIAKKNAKEAKKM